MAFVSEPLSNEWHTQIYCLLPKLFSCLSCIYIANCIQHINTISCSKQSVNLIREKLFRLSIANNTEINLMKTEKVQKYVGKLRDVYFKNSTFQDIPALIWSHTFMLLDDPKKPGILLSKRLIKSPWFKWVISNLHSNMKDFRHWHQILWKLTTYGKIYR